MKNIVCKINPADKRSIAQGTIEYLVILAIITIISLVVVQLVINQVDSSSSIQVTSSKIGTVVGSSGISVSSSVAGADENGLLVIKNLNFENLTLNKIVVDGVNHNYSEQIVSGDEKGFKLQSIGACTDEKKNYSVKVEYTSSSGLTKVADFGEVLIDCVPIVSSNILTIEEGEDNDEEVVTPNVLPSISLVSPSDNYSGSQTRVSFAFNPTDSDGTIQECSLNLSNLLDANSITNVLEDQENIIEYTLSVGVYDWNISCTDNNSDTNTSVTQTITIEQGALIEGGNLVVHYFMNDNDYSSVVLDNVSSNNGVASANTVDMTASGKINNALYFDGGKSIALSNISLSNTYSVSMWINPSEIGSYYGGLITQYSDIGLFFITGYSWGSACDYQATFYNYGDNGQSPVMSANSWHHLVLSVSDGTGTWYVDGALGGSQSYGLPAWSPSYIGNDNIGEAFYGSIDDVRIYDRALTESEVLLIYNSNNGTEAE